MDRGDIIQARNKKRARRQFVNDLDGQRRLILDFTKSGLPALAANQYASKAAANLDPKLTALASNLDGISQLEQSDPISLSQGIERKAWATHERSFVALLLASSKVPSFSMKAISAPAAYNLSPLLYQDVESPIFADNSAPNKVLVGRSFGGDKTVLFKGDEILAFKDAGEADWTPVNSWRDLLHNASSSSEEDSKSQITLRIRRGRSTREVKVGYVSSLVFVD